MKKTNKNWIIATCFAFVLTILSAFIVGLGGVMNFIPAGQANGITYGLKAAIADYGANWTFSTSGRRAMLQAGFVIVGALFFVLASIVTIKKKKYFGFIGVIGGTCAILFVPFLAILAAIIYRASAMTVAALWTIAVSAVLLALGFIFSIYSLATAPSMAKEEEKEEEVAAPAAKEAVFDEEAARRVADEEISKAFDAREEGISEDRVNELIADAIAAHNEELHTEYVEEETDSEEEETPAEEAKPVEDAKEEVAAEETASEETPDDDDPFSKLRSKKRASFETRLKKADADLRHKYYDLRDYIKSYGVKNRISNPGDTFSAHRERYVFVTISGKHIKAFFALDPKDYESGTIPVEKMDSKKYEDIPCCLRIKSDLSYRRAMKLVDDVMAKKGVAKPEAPKDEESK